MSDRIPEYTTLRSEHWPERYLGEFQARMRIERLREKRARAEHAVRVLTERYRAGKAEFDRLRDSSEDVDGLDYFADGLEGLEQRRKHASKEAERLSEVIERAEQRDIMGEPFEEEE